MTPAYLLGMKTTTDLATVCYWKSATTSAHVEPTVNVDLDSIVLDLAKPAKGRKVAK
jgi:hypothetical protein